MTSESIIPGPAVTDEAEPEPPAPGVGGTPEDETPEERRRRLLPLLLLLLLAAVVAMFLFLGWYLLFRKPVSEFPLPGVTVSPVPHYSYSIYDVIAPTGVAVNADGSRIYATQTEGDRMVIAFDASGKQVATLTPPDAATAAHVPVYVALNPVTRDVYVSDRATASVYVFAADGAFLRTFDPGPDLKGWAPLGLAFGAKGDLFVTNVGAPFQSVVQFGPEGTLLRTYGTEGEFNFPNGVAVDANGNVYVSDSNNGRLVTFDRDGTELGVIRRGVSVGDLGLPRGAAIDDTGRIYVADVSQQGIQSYQAIAAGQRSPTFIGGFGEEGTADGAFRLPNAVAVDGRSRVYVADWRNNRIQVWSY